MIQSIPSNALPVGCRLEGYEIVAMMGQGVLGNTYRVVELEQARSVIMQEYLPPNLALRGDGGCVQPLSSVTAELFHWGLDRFMSEAQALSRVQSSAIVTVLNTFRAAQTGYVIMEYVDGVSFRSVLDDEYLPEEADLQQLLVPLLEGIERVHDAGLLHGAIIPEHIYLRQDGSPSLLQFAGARQAIAAPCQALAAVISPPYTPFEVYALGSGHDRRGPWSDIYGLGACLYQAVTGVPPLDAMSRADALLTGKFQVQACAAELGQEHYSPAFLAAIDRALAFLPEYRPQCVADWRTMLLVGSAGALPPQASAGAVHWDGLPEAPAPRTPTATATADPTDEDGAEPLAERLGSDAAKPLPTADTVTRVAEPEHVPASAQATATPFPGAVARGPDLMGEPAGLWKRIAFPLGIASLALVAGLVLWLLAGRERSEPHEVLATPPRVEQAQRGIDTQGEAVVARVEPLALAQLQPLLAAQPCLIARAEERNGQLQWLGYGSAAAVSGVMASLPAATRTAIGDPFGGPFVRLDEPFCPVLELYRQPWLEGVGAGSSARVALPAQRQAVREGEALVLELVAPDFDAYVYLDYFTRDGQVVHMVPGPRFAENQMRAGASSTIGELEQWRIAPPYGRELLVMLSVSQPLFTEARVEIESAEKYLAAVKVALQRLSADSGARIDARLLAVDVVAQP